MDFYPRPPRGGRLSRCNHATGWMDFYPRPPRGGRLPGAVAGRVCPALISIHALREEGDPDHPAHTGAGQNFYPRPPRGGRQKALGTLCRHRLYFYPRPPRGGRQQKRRKASPLLFHYKTICTDLEELFQKHPKKTAAICTERLENMVRRRRKRGERFPFAPREQARKSARLRIQTGDELRYARPWSYSCCPVDKTADCPDRGR